MTPAQLTAPLRRASVVVDYIERGVLVFHSSYSLCLSDGGNHSDIIDGKGRDNEIGIRKRLVDTRTWAVNCTARRWPLRKKPHHRGISDRIREVVLRRSPYRQGAYGPASRSANRPRSCSESAATSSRTWKPLRDGDGNWQATGGHREVLRTRMARRPDYATDIGFLDHLVSRRIAKDLLGLRGL